MPASALSRRKKAEHMGKAEILVVKEEVLMLKEGVLMLKEEVLMLKEEVFMEVNVVKDVVKFVAENSIMEEDIMKAVFMKEDMGIIVALPIVIGTMCCMRWP